MGDILRVILFFHLQASIMRDWGIRELAKAFIHRDCVA